MLKKIVKFTHYKKAKIGKQNKQLAKLGCFQMIPFNSLGFVFKHFGSVIYPKEVLQELCIFLKPFQNQESVLDIGAGTAVMSAFAYGCNSELRYVAVDPAEGMLKYAPEYLQTHITHAEALPFEDESFDAILTGESLHHLRDPHVSFEEAKRVLKKTGNSLFMILM